MIVRFDVQWSLLGEEIHNVLHYDAGSLNLEDMQAYVDYMFDTFEELGAPQLSDDLVMLSVTCYDASTPEPIGLQFLPTGGSQAGNLTTGNMPPVLAVLVTSNSVTTTYPHSTRIYLGGITETTNEATGRPNTTLRTACNLWVEAWNILNPGEVPTLPRVAVTYNVDNQVIAYAQVFNAFVSAKYSTQRRRNYD